MKKSHEELVYSPKIIEMLTVANEYCLFMEELERYDRDYILMYVLRLCPLLYLKGSLLPIVEVSDESANERYVTEEQWQAVFLGLQEKLNEADKFWYLDHTDPLSPLTPVQGSLAEHLADIYQDLKDFVWLYQKNLQSAKENAANSCRLYFESHWGYRVANIMRVAHHLHYKTEEGARSEVQD